MFMSLTTTHHSRHHHYIPGVPQRRGKEVSEREIHLMYFTVGGRGRGRSVPMTQVADLAPGLLNKGSYFQRGAGGAGGGGEEAACVAR